MLFSAELRLGGAGRVQIVSPFIKSLHLHLTLREDDPILILTTISKFVKGALRIGPKMLGQTWPV